MVLRGGIFLAIAMATFLRAGSFKQPPTPKPNILAETLAAAKLKARAGRDAIVVRRAKQACFYQLLTSPHPGPRAQKEKEAEEVAAAAAARREAAEAAHAASGAVDGAQIIEELRRWARGEVRRGLSSPSPNQIG